MKQFIAIESSSGRAIYVTARDEEDAYRVIGSVLYKMGDTIDTGNVDVDVFPITPESVATARYLTSS